MDVSVKSFGKKPMVLPCTPEKPNFGDLYKTFIVLVTSRLWTLRAA